MGIWEKKKMERETGIEPATSSLGSWRSTAELLPPGDEARLPFSTTEFNVIAVLSLRSAGAYHDQSSGRPCLMNRREWLRTASLSTAAIALPFSARSSPA